MLAVSLLLFLDSFLEAWRLLGTGSAKLSLSEWCEKRVCFTVNMPRESQVTAGAQVEGR